MRWRVALVAVALAGTAAACGPDTGLTALDATPIAPPPTAAPPAPTVPPTAPVTTPPPSAPVLPTLPPNPPPQTTPPEPTGPTLPPILEPELFTEVALADVVDVGAERRPRDYDALLAVALVDIDNWLTDELPDAFGTTWRPLEGGIWAGYPGRADDLPGCGEPITAYEDLMLYAAFYCEFGDFMAFDDGDEGIIVGLAEELGPAVLGVVLAHEYGHAVQQRTGALDEGRPTVLTEQQADCVSGAWLGRSYRGESPNLRLGDADLRAGLVAMVEVRDPVGVDQFELGGHGTAFDRVGAFQLGFTDGLASCAGLLDDPLPLMPNVFQSWLDLDRGGNAPYDCAEVPPAERADCIPAPQFLADDLNDYWQDRHPGFPTLQPLGVADFARFDCADEVAITDVVSYCPGDNAIVYDEPYVIDLYREFGDFTLGYFYGLAWAEVAQLGDGSTLTGEPRALRNDCETGAWVRDITPDEFGRTRRNDDLDGDGEPDSTVVTSPGDLDEAVRMAILLGDLGANIDEVGSPFEKIANFRAGVLGGPSACIP